MNYNEWLYSYTKLNGKINKKSPLTTEELDELFEIIDKVKTYINTLEYEVIKRQ